MVLWDPLVEILSISMKGQEELVIAEKHLQLLGSCH